ERRDDHERDDERLLRGGLASIDEGGDGGPLRRGSGHGAPFVRCGSDNGTATTGTPGGAFAVVAPGNPAFGAEPVVGSAVVAVVSSSIVVKRPWRVTVGFAGVRGASSSSGGGPAQPPVGTQPAGSATPYGEQVCRR